MTSHVIWSVTPSQSSSPYIRDIVDAIEQAGWSVGSLSFRELATTTNQIVHIQWPEHVSRGPSRMRTTAKHIRAIALLAVLRARQHHVVLTAHNRAPHGESDLVDAWFRRQIQHLARAIVLLVPGHESMLRLDGAIGPDAIVELIRHPIHAPSTSPNRSSANSTGGLFILGQIHPYHRLLEFVDALADGGMARPVTIAGSVGDEQLLATLNERASTLPWLSVLPGFLSDDELTPLLEQSAAMVSLQRNSFNSGGPFYALPRSLPIIMSRGPQADDISAAVGSDWVFGVPDDVQAIDITLLNEWLDIERSEPHLERFSLDDIAASHIRLYELLRS